MLSDDEQGLGDLFGAGDEAAEVVYPVEQLVVDRMQLRHEGTTNNGFTPLLHRFDSPSPNRNNNINNNNNNRESNNVCLSPLNVYFRNKRHSLWGHRLWNAAKYIVKRMDTNMIDVRGRSVLELGAGLGVPSLAAFRNGARCVVVTDYPDVDLLEILEMNVKENCRPGMIDNDAAAFLVQEAVRIKARQMNWNNNSNNNNDERELTEDERRRVLNTQCVVEPLLWGKEKHIRKVLSYTGGCGFDIVLLSDILFNHICNDDLADTVARVLQRSKHAAAYCVFSHHRAHKQVEDLQFFDKCVARGLSCEQIDEEIYPMMFPDDRGPVEIRQPVKVYKIVHSFDDAGAPFEPGSSDDFDVVIQGTGMVESMVSAALARSGVRVLHCDGEDDYGGAFKTMTVEQLRKFIKSPLIASTRITRSGRGNACDSDNNNNNDGQKTLGVIYVDRMDEIVDLRTRRRFLLDLLPTHYLSNGKTVRELINSDMTRHMDFQPLTNFSFMLMSSEGDYKLQSIPLTRAQVFSAKNISLIQKRRLMKFVKDVEASLAEQLHARTAYVGDDPHSQAALKKAELSSEEAKRLFAQEANAHPNELLSTMIERKYGITGETLDMVTLLRELDTRPGDVLHSVELVREVLTSIGLFGSATPFLQPMYGTSEMPQNMCRTAAVWNATVILRRSLLLPTFSSSVSHGLETSVVESNTPSIEMSNRQRVKAKVVVVPRTLARHFSSLSSVATPAVVVDKVMNDKEEDVCFSRVILVSKTPLFSWKSLHAAGCIGEEEFSEDTETMKSFPPLVLSLCRVRPGVVVHIQQVSAAAEQAPNDGTSVVVHFTADERKMGMEELHKFVSQTFLQSVDAADINASIHVNENDVLFLASFVLREEEEALRGIIHTTPDDTLHLSETRKAHPYAIEEYNGRQEQKKRQHEQMCGKDSENSNSGESPGVVFVPTLFRNCIDDGAYVTTARCVYNDVVAALKLQEGGGDSGKKYIFFERLPPLPEPISS